MDEERVQLGQQGFHVVEAFGHPVGVHVVLVEVLVERAGGVEKPAYLAVAGFRADSVGGSVVIAVAVVLPAPVFGDGLEHMSGGALPFLGCLREVAGGDFRSGLLQKILAGLSVLLGGHLGILLLLLQVSVSNLFGQCFCGDLGDVRF